MYHELSAQLAAIQANFNESLKVDLDRFNAVLAEPDVKKRLIELGGPPLIGTPEAFGATIKAETEKWDKVVKSADIKIE